jgi:rhodanese-related sulfurtransferase
VAQYLQQNGFPETCALKGGYAAWQQQNYPLVRKQPAGAGGAA